MSTVPVPHEDDDGGLYSDSDYGASTYQQQGRLYGGGGSNSGGGGYTTETGRRMTGLPQSASPALPASSTSSSDSNGKSGVRYVGVPLQFQWSGPQRLKDGTVAPAEKTSGTVLQHAPLEKALIAQGLSPHQGINIAELRVLKATNASKQKIGVQFLNVNGENLDNFVSSDGEKATLVLHPGESVNFTHHDGGKGLLLASNPLNPEDQINVNMSPTEMIKDARAHPDKPGMVTTTLDLSGYLQDGTPESQLKPLSPLGLLILANAKAELKSNRAIDPEIRAKLLPPSDEEEKTSMLPGIQLAPTPFKPGSYDALIDREHLESLVHQYASDNAAKAQPTSAIDHIVRVVPLGAGVGAHIGDLSNAIGLSQREIDLAHATRQGVHLDVMYAIQHNGKKYDAKQ